VKLLFDQNLSHRLVHLLRDEYPNSQHVRFLGLENAQDEEIWEQAHGDGYIIVSKDSDFYQRSLLQGHPPKVVSIALGNCSTESIVDLLKANLVIVERFAFDNDEAFLMLG
jgi:predicted nuclease of predicted toxin-antitoxin system